MQSNFLECCSPDHNIWLRICVKKLIFLHTIVRLNDDSMVKMLAKSRAKTFNENIMIGLQNAHKSPLFEIFKVSHDFGMYDEVMRMIFGVIVYSKSQWRDKIWKIAWDMEDRYWVNNAILYRNENLLFKTTLNPRYLTWWHLSDLIPSMMRVCEDMARMVCGTSNLKCDDPKHRKETLSNRACTLCNSGNEENTFHLVMQCPYHEATRICMYNDIDKLQVESYNIFNELQGNEKFLTLMGKNVLTIDQDDMLKLWTISGYYISMMYRTTIYNQNAVT